MKILVVDDEMPIRELLRHKLSRVGFEVSTARNGHEFMNFAMEQKPDLIILDIWLNQGLGPDVYHELLERGFSKDVPVIFITALVEGRSGNGQIFPGQKYSLFSKPFNFEKLIKEIQGLLNFTENQKSN